MYNRRVSKADARVEAYGTVDELNATLGMARAVARRAALRRQILAIQQDLILLMGELATTPSDWHRYAQDGFRQVDAAMIARLEELAAQLESQLEPSRGWAQPGDNPLAAAFDLARTVCRRAERCVCRLRNANQHPNPQALVFLNRLADVLWLYARQAERTTKSSKGRRRTATR